MTRFADSGGASIPIESESSVSRLGSLLQSVVGSRLIAFGMMVLPACGSSGSGQNCPPSDSALGGNGGSSNSALGGNAGSGSSATTQSQGGRSEVESDPFGGGNQGGGSGVAGHSLGPETAGSSGTMQRGGSAGAAGDLPSYGGSTLVAGAGGNSGAGGSSVTACAEGTADCDGLTENGCETSTAGSARHCGQCWHNCEEGFCSAGVCQPVVIEDVGTSWAGLTIGGEYVYWSTLPVNDGSGAPKPTEIHRCPTSGCSSGPERFADQFNWTSVARSDDGLSIVADGRDVYWIDGATTVDYGAQNRLLHCPATGCGTSGPESLATVEYGGRVGLSSEYLVWRDFDGDQVWTMLRSGGQPISVAVSQSNEGVVVADAEYVYWVTAAQIRRCALGATCDDWAIEILFESPEAVGSIVQLVHADHALFWVVQGRSGESILTMELKDDASPRELVSKLNKPIIHVAKGQLFWAEASHEAPYGTSLSSCTLPGCGDARTLVTNEAFPVSRLTGDGSRLFWLANTQIRKLVLP